MQYTSMPKPVMESRERYQVSRLIFASLGPEGFEYCKEMVE